ncbi:MAG TPA: prepilin-type N-terminal cleavage/methylation domain-containing protein [Nitrospira sp.]|nr:prepilin-type N-terminal cleavage/methylation domain-containing protein [Nitrospira sp.]
MSGVIPRDQTVTHAAVLDPRGFTLMEVLIAMAILALALPILLGLRNWDLNLQSRAADITAATMLAQEKLIEAELSPVYPVGETTGDFRNPPPGYQVPGDVAERAPRYRWKRIITTTPLTAVREVKIQILWEQGATDEVLEASTYVFAPTTGF